ncbi:hypothetical protein BDF19DRAFT_188812 [Syncephalis fuscata]|nr:hypothetical protein BDF19DRAFT_188812 [Syncephalis fuscata]
MATEGSYDRLANFIKFLDQHSAEDTFTSGILVELTGKLVKEGIAGLSEAIDPEPTQDIVAKQLPEQRGVACSPMIWSALDKVQNIKAKNAILNAGVAIIYLWWRTPKAENDEVQHRRITFPYVIDVLYRCFVHCADTCNDNEKTDELLIINGCLLSMLSGIATTTNPDHERTWTPYMEKLCRADHGLDLALQRIFSRTNDQVDATIQMSLQKFNQYHQSITSAAGARYLRLLHALLRTWFSKEAVSRRGSYLMTLWSPLWRVLVHAMWLAGGSSSVIDRKEIRQRVISIANRLIRWQTTELKDDYVACVQLQPCVVSLADWYQLGHKELPSNDQHSNDKEVDWRASLVKAIVHTVQFISRHLGLDASAMEAVKQLVDNTPIIDGILSREQVQTLKRALCRKPDLDLDALLDMNTDIDLDDDDVEVNTKTNTSQALPTSKEILDPSKKHISTSMNMESTSASTSSTVPKTRTNEDLLSEPTKRSRVEVTVPVRTISRIDQIVEKKSPTTTTRPSEQPSARSISKAWKGFEEGAVITASAATRPSSARYSLGSRFVSSSNESTGSSSLLRQMRSDLVRERAPLRTAIRQQRHNFTATGSTLQNKHPSAPKRVITTPTTSVASTTFNEPATNTANSSDYDPVLDSDSDSDSDGFAGIMQDQMNRSMDASTAANQEKRTVQMIELPRSNWVGNTSIQQPRTQVAPRQAAPVKPRRITLDDLHYAIVQWRPSEMNDMPSTLQTKCSMAADCYRSAEEYVDVMQPLSVLECWQQISGALEMFAKQPQSCSAVLSSRSKIDDFNEIQFTCEDALDVIIENDVILLVEDPAGTLTINRQLLERNPPLGVVREINYHRDGRNIRVRTSGRNSPHCTAYHFGSHWRLIKVTSLTTIHREFEVLGRFNNYLLCNDIIRPPARQKILYDDAQLNEVAKKYAINKSQARAVLDSTTLEHGFLLIQGPPGTGN